MDEEFRSIVNEMKPLAKLLQRNSERRHNITAWIKRLLSENDRVCRNQYAKQLLSVLKSGRFIAPFNSAPPVHLSQTDELDSLFQSVTGPVPPPVPPSRSPSLTSSHYSPSPRGHPSSPPAMSYDHWSMSPPTREPSGGIRHSTPKDSDRGVASHGLVYNESEGKLNNSFPRNYSKGKRRSQRFLTFSSSSESLDGATTLDSVNCERESSTVNISSSSSCDDITVVSNNSIMAEPTIKQRLSLSDVPVITSTTHAAAANRNRCRSLNSPVTSPTHYVPRLHVESSSGEKNRFLIKTLEKKSREMEDMRRKHLQQVKHLEKRCNSLEHTVNKMEREKRANHYSLREDSVRVKDSQCTAHGQQTSYEKQLQATVRDFECQQMELRQRHSLELKQTMDRAKMAVEQLKNEHSRQQHEMVKSLSEADGKLQKSIQSVETANRTNRKLLKEKNSLSETISTLENQLKLSKKSIKSLEEKVAVLIEENTTLQSKGNINVQTVKQQMAVQRGDLLRKIDTLQQEVVTLQSKLEEETTRQNTRLENAENQHKLSSKETEIEYQKKITELSSSLQEKERRCLELELVLKTTSKENDDQLSEVKSAYESQCKSVEEYRSKIEQQMKGVFGDMSDDIKKLESELNEEHRLRKKKEEELYLELSAQRAKMVEEHSELVQSMKEHYKAEMDAKDQAIQDLTIQQKEQAAKHKSELEHKQRSITDAKKTIASLDNQIQEQLQRHQDQLNKVRKAYEADKQLLVKSQDKLVVEMTTELEKNHKLEIASINEKHKIQLRQLEHDENMKASIANETIASLQSQNRALKEDLERCLESHKKELDDIIKQRDWDLRSSELKHEAEKKVMMESIENSRQCSEQLESRIANLQQTYEYELSRLKSEYETRISTYHIASSHQEMIQSLQLQLQSMTTKADSLQKQLDQSLTCAKIKKHFKSAPTSPLTVSTATGCTTCTSSKNPANTRK